MISNIKQFSIIPATEEFTVQTPYNNQNKSLTYKPGIYVFLITLVSILLLAIFFKVLLTTIQHNDKIKSIEYYSFGRQQNKIKIDSIKNQLAELKSYLNKNTNFEVNLKNRKYPNRRVVKDQYKFILPKIIWVYLERVVEEETYVVQRCLINIKYYAQLSGFQLRIIDTKSYAKYLPVQDSLQLSNIITRLQEKRQNDAQLHSKFQKVRETLIKLYLFRQFGGVVISKDYIFTETLEWLQNIKANILVNAGNRETKPSYFTFFSILDGPPPAKQDRKVQYQVDKYMIVSPAVRDYFLAGVAGGQYIKDVLSKYIQLIQSSNSVHKIAKSKGLHYENLNFTNLNNFFTIASHFVITQKQQELNNNKEQDNGRGHKMAIDEYGLFTINSNYFADKIQFYFNNQFHYYDNYYNFVAKLPLDQFQASIGPIRYIANPDPFGEFNSRIQNAIKKQGKYSIVWGSFIHKYLFMEEKYDFIDQNKENRNSFATFKKWNLPKTLWLYWDKGFDNLPISLEFILKNLINKAQSSDYKVIKVSDKNSHRYIPPSVLKRMKDILKSQKMGVGPQTKSDFHRLALISTHGGVYLDCSYIFLQNFRWIEDIANEQTQLIFNRFGQVPKVLLQFHPIEGGPFDWKINQKYNTKVQWHLAYQSNFLAAEQDSEFVKDWFEQFLWFVNSTYEQTEIRMAECGIMSHKWTNPHFRYLTVMDSLKAVLGCKQNQIDRNRQKYGDIADATDYYKLWAINGFTGIQKYRYYNSYANYLTDHHLDNVMIYRYSEEYTEQVYGPTYKAIKFYSANQGPLNSFILNNKENFLLESHPNSVFMKYIIGQSNIQASVSTAN